MDKDYNELEGRLTISKDTTLRQLFGGKDENYSICYFDKNSEYLEQVENLDTLQFHFSIPYGSNNERVVYDNNYLDTKISSFYEDLGAKKYDERLTFSLLEINDNLTKLNIIMPVVIDSELKEEIDLFFMGIFPYQLTDLGFPTYNGQNCLYNYKNDIQPLVDISNTNQTELLAFESNLEQVDSGWKKDTSGTNVHYRKFVSPTLYEMEIITSDISSGSVRIVYNKVDWPRNAIKLASSGLLDFDFPPTENGYFEIDSKKSGLITLKNFSTFEQEAFANDLLTLGDNANIRDNTLYILKDNVIYQFGFTISEGDIILDYTHKSNLDVNECELIIEKDGTYYKSIHLANDLKGYFIKEEFESGVYKVKKHDLVANTTVELDISGAAEVGYKDNLSYNSETKALTVLNKTTLDLRMNFNEQSQVTLFNLID